MNEKPLPKNFCPIASITVWVLIRKRGDQRWMNIWKMANTKLTQWYLFEGVWLAFFALPVFVLYVIVCNFVSLWKVHVCECACLRIDVSCALSLASLSLLLVSSYPYPSLFAFISSLIYLFPFLLPVGWDSKKGHRSEWVKRRGREGRGRGRGRGKTAIRIYCMKKCIFNIKK